MPSLHEDRLTFHDFINGVMEDFESIVQYHPDARSILHQIYFGIHHTRLDSKGYFDIGPHFDKNIRISSFEMAEMHYRDADRRDHFYDAYDINDEIIRYSTWNQEMITQIFEYVSVNRYLQRFKVKICNQNDEEILSFPHLFSLDTPTSRNEFHDFILQQIILYTSHLMKPYSTLISYMKGLIQYYDRHHIGNGHFIEVMEIHQTKRFEHNPDDESHYETAFHCVFDLFRDRRNPIDGSVFEERYEFMITIHQDIEGFPIRILFKDDDYQAEFNSKYEEYHGKQKPFIHYRQIRDFIDCNIDNWIDLHE